MTAGRLGVAFAAVLDSVNATPVAPGATPDGKGDPAGRLKNRGVEVVVDTRTPRK